MTIGVAGYDSTVATQQHIAFVDVFLSHFSDELCRRAKEHDASKLQEPEKSCYDKWRPVLDALLIDSPEYKDALAQMGEGLKHHYVANSHHPEHYSNGVDGMTLLDLVEMVCDWQAAAGAKDQPVNMDYVTKRFNLSPQLASIIRNTLIAE